VSFYTFFLKDTYFRHIQKYYLSDYEQFHMCLEVIFNKCDRITLKKHSIGLIMNNFICV